MEQRRFSGKGHWYHETQTNHCPDDVLPLVPEAANVADRFLLDLALPNEIVTHCERWLTPSLVLRERLFPRQVQLSRLHTLSAYDRLSTALTVAQAPASSDYAITTPPFWLLFRDRTLHVKAINVSPKLPNMLVSSCSPDVIDSRAQMQLDEVGLTTYDVILINQIIGFIGFQARVVASFQALLGHPVRWLPGHHIPPHAQIDDINMSEWASIIPGVELRYASAQQLESLARWQSEVCLGDLAPVLCHEPELLDCLGEILTSGIKDLPAQYANHPSLPAGVDLLARSPDRFSAAQLTPLIDDGIPAADAINLLTWSAFCGWLNRLKIALRAGE